MSVKTSILIRELHLKNLVRISVESGVNIATLYNIRNGKTKFPQHRTLTRILPVMGLSLEIYYRETI